MKENTSTQQKQNMWIRLCFAFIIGLFVAVYTISILIGKIPYGQRIDAVRFSIILLTVGIILLLLKPNITDRLKLFEGAGFKFELEQVKENQDKQALKLGQQAQLLA